MTGIWPGHYGFVMCGGGDLRAAGQGQSQPRKEAAAEGEKFNEREARRQLRRARTLPGVRFAVFDRVVPNV
jgi:hypothetical protein